MFLLLTYIQWRRVTIFAWRIRYFTDRNYFVTLIFCYKFNSTDEFAESWGYTPPTPPPLPRSLHPCTYLTCHKSSFSHSLRAPLLPFSWHYFTILFFLNRGYFPNYYNIWVHFCDLTRHQDPWETCASRVCCFNSTQRRTS